jgi:hypothetical protein
MGTDVNWDEVRAVLRIEMIDGEAAGIDAARRALEMILGTETLSVDYYVALRPARELVRSVLWLLRPWSAMARCHELAQSPNEIEIRQNAVRLLQVVGDHRAFPWVSEFLNEQDPVIQTCGIGLLDQLLWSELIEPKDAEQVLESAERHENEGVRERAEFIRSFLRARSEENA